MRDKLLLIILRCFAFELMWLMIHSNPIDHFDHAFIPSFGSAIGTNVPRKATYRVPASWYIHILSVVRVDNLRNSETVSNGFQDNYTDQNNVYR